MGGYSTPSAADQNSLMQALALLQELVGAPITGQFYQYDSGPQVLTALAAGQAGVTVLSNPFLLMAIMSTQTGAFTLQIIDGQSKNYFSQNPVPNASLCGTAQAPFYLAQPYLFQTNAQIQVPIVDLSNAGNTVELTFTGINPDTRSLDILQQFRLWNAKGGT